jgi:hypothetical protein
MPKRPLDLEILRKNRREAVLETEADPANYSVLEDHLKGWLSGDGWDGGRWGEFEMIVRPAGEGKILARVRVRV